MKLGQQMQQIAIALKVRWVFLIHVRGSVVQGDSGSNFRAYHLSAFEQATQKVAAMETIAAGLTTQKCLAIHAAEHVLSQHEIGEDVFPHELPGH